MYFRRETENKYKLHYCGQCLSEDLGEGDVEVLCIVLEKFL